MTDYIKRIDALDIVAYNRVNGEITPNRYDKIIDGIYEIPSADVAPVRHGRWMKNDDYTCSLCGYRMVIGDGAYNYCPNCGARMDGGEDDD